MNVVTLVMYWMVSRYPTAGDTTCDEVRDFAKELGVCVHAVHLCGHTVKWTHAQTIPTPVRNLADGTGGSKFFAHLNPDTGECGQLSTN